MNNQAAQILALQEALARQTNRTSQNPSSLFVPTSDASTPRSASSAYENGSSESFVRKQESLPKPPEFEGKSREFKPWLSQMEAKLIVDKAHESEIVRFWYVHSRLRGRALEQITPWVISTQKMGNSLTVEGLFKQLRNAYEDHESAERAARKLNVLRQGMTPFTTFLAEFDRTILEAGGLHWDEQVKKTFLSNGISENLQEALIATPIPPTYDGYCQLLQTVNNNLEALRSKRRKDTSRTIASTPQAKQIGEAMDWEPTPAIAAASMRTKRAKWVSPGTIDERRRNGQCYRCGKDGHIVRDCDLLPAVRPVVQTAAQQQQRVITESPKGRVAPGQNRDQEQRTKPTLEEWKEFEKKMDQPPFLVPVLIDQLYYAKTLLDSGCLSYGLIDSKFASKCDLERLKISPRKMDGFEDLTEGVCDEVAVVRLDINGHTERAFFYVAPRLAAYDVILGDPWMKMNDARYSPRQARLYIGSTGTCVWNSYGKREKKLDCKLISAAGFATHMRKHAKGAKLQIFTASMVDIDKALAKKKKIDPRTKLPKHYWEHLSLFDDKEANKLPPLRGDGVDHRIELTSTDGKKPIVPWGPLYNMSQDELLVLRRTLTELLEKNFIRVSNSLAAAPVLFVRKPGGGLRFCVDYRGLNKLTKKDRYPLPLIYETLRNIGKAKWFTKLDVVSAFHKIRIAEGDEWMTAFRTRYGLFEWMVTPFGLANAPSTFQKYINWALRDYLDEFCSAYVDDVLIYTDGSLEQHRGHVRQVLQRLQEAGLQLDISKCEFETQRTKYLGFIIEAEVGISMDPAKVEAITSWEAPKTIKGVQSFLGFANFYRQFIKDFSKLAMPLTSLVRRDTPFTWTDDANRAFKEMKEIFVSASILVQFNYERETVLETDASEWCIGGTLMQYDERGVLHPCAYYSKKNNPAECNYEIYDKEMLAIVRCLEEWDAELRSVSQFEIRTDHKNLEYFMSVRKLTERQMRWSLALSKYNFTISYLPGKQNERADALSRREQDVPNIADGRLEHRMTQMLKPQVLKGLKFGTIQACPQRTNPVVQHDASEAVVLEATNQLKTTSYETENLQNLWNEAEKQDELLLELTKAVREERRTFPTKLEIKVSIGDCELDESDKLLFRKRKWVPQSDELRTKIIQGTHDSMITGHPGREVTSSLVSRDFFWPNMLADIRRFVRNCDVCGRNKAWKERRQGFLKPLPISDRTWQELSMDFITDLPESEGCTNLIVFTDRLGKGTILESCQSMTAPAVANIFVRCVYRHHGLPRAIVSDRGSQFVGLVWKRVCQLLDIKRRLSTAYHPETDGATERMNQNVETYLRTFVSYDQDDWSTLLPMAELALNNRDAASTGVSPFFLSHGFHARVLDVCDDLRQSYEKRSPIQQGEAIVAKLQKASEWAQASMAIAQQNQERTTNRYRMQSPKFKVGDKVWLNLKNIHTTRPCKKLDAKQAKYTVIQIVGSHSYRLDTPPGIHNVFHSDRLKLVASDPLPLQTCDDMQPGSILVENNDEYEVEKILDVRSRGRGQQYSVKWVGYARPTWEPTFALKDTAALDAYEARQGEEGDDVTG